jgi:hypothetical protein
MIFFLPEMNFEIADSYIDLNGIVSKSLNQSIQNKKISCFLNN